MSNFNNEKFTMMKPSSIITDTIYESTEPYHTSESDNLDASNEGRKDTCHYNCVTVTNLETMFPVGITGDSSFTKTCVDTGDRHQSLQAAVFESETQQSSESRNVIGCMNRIPPAAFIDTSFSQIQQKGDRWKTSDRDSATYLQEKRVANDVGFGLPCKTSNNYFIVASSGRSFTD